MLEVEKMCGLLWSTASKALERELIGDECGSALIGFFQVGDY